MHQEDAMKKSEIRQNKILDFMKKTIAEKGYSPTVREICAALKIKSTSTVHSDIKALEEKGLVKKDQAKPRTVLPVSNEYIKTASESFDTVSLPVVGNVAAGEPILAEQNIIDEMPIPSRFVGSGNNFILTVHGIIVLNVGLDTEFLHRRAALLAYVRMQTVGTVTAVAENRAAQAALDVVECHVHREHGVMGLKGEHRAVALLGPADHAGIGRRGNAQ
jgi:SOS regulatory protein LexA